MYETLFKRPTVLARYRKGPLSEAGRIPDFPTFQCQEVSPRSRAGIPE